MFIGDVTYGGLQRADLEKVDGALPGRAVPDDPGPRGRRQPRAQGPRRRAIIGGLGAGGNWGQNGKLRYGLQKLDPSGRRALRHGVDGRHRGRLRDRPTPSRSRPRPLADLRVASTRSSSGATAPTAQYGGPKLDEETCSRHRARPPARTARRSRSQVDGLKPDRVVHLRSPRPFASAAGEHAVEHRGLVHPQQLPRLRRDRPEPVRRHLRARGRRALRHRRRSTPSTPATPGPASSTASRPSARAPPSSRRRPRPAPTTCRSATPTAPTRSPTRPRR